MMSEGNGNIRQEFAVRVAQALEDAEASDFCAGCGESGAGWDGWIFPPEPGVLLGRSGGAILVANITCKRCGFVKTYALKTLGVEVEESRIIQTTGRPM